MKCTECKTEMIEISADFYQCPACGEERMDDSDIVEKLTGKKTKKFNKGIKKFKNRWNEFNKKDNPRRHNQFRKSKEWEKS